MGLIMKQSNLRYSIQTKHLSLFERILIFFVVYGSKVLTHVWLTKVLITLSLKFILSVYPVKKRGTYEGGDGQPDDFMSKEHGIPLSRLTVGRPESD